MPKGVGPKPFKPEETEAIHRLFAKYVKGGKLDNNGLKFDNDPDFVTLNNTRGLRAIQQWIYIRINRAKAGRNLPATVATVPGAPKKYNYYVKVADRVPGMNLDNSGKVRKKPRTDVVHVNSQPEPHIIQPNAGPNYCPQCGECLASWKK